jgi:parvulin-like peptidyl-prolyl isomerase
MSKTGSAPAAPLTRKQQSRVQREQRQRRYIVIAAAVVAALVVVIIGAGVFDQVILKPRQVVARVAGTNITMGQFIKAAKFQRYQLIDRYFSVVETAQFFAGDPSSEQFFQQQLSQILTQLNDPTTLGQTVLDNLVNNELVRQEAARRGITVSAAEVDKAYEEYFGFYPDGTPTPTTTFTPAPTLTPNATREAQLTAAPSLTAAAAATLTETVTPAPTITPTATLTPTNTPAPTLTSTPGPSPTATSTSTPRPTATPFTTQGFATLSSGFQRNLRSETGMSTADLRYLLESLLYNEKLAEVLGQAVSTTAEQAHVRHILVDNPQLAQVVVEQLRAGADFGELALQYSFDESNKANGGDLGWISRGDTVAEFEAAAFSLPVGEISDPVQSEFGYHVIEVLAREQRELEPADLEEARGQALDDWLAAQRATPLPDGRPTVEVFDIWRDDVPDTPRLPTQ